MRWILCMVGAYLMGSIPCGFIIGRLRGVDIRQHGSHNIGATNVGRVLGRRMGMLCFVLDTCKGAIPVLVTGALFGLLGGRPASVDPVRVKLIDQGQLCLWLGVACCAVLGHMYSVFLGFRGGKGVATGFGALAAMWEVLTVPAFGALVVWYFVLRLTRYISVASICAALSMPVGYVLSVLPRDAFHRPFRDSLQQVAQGWPPLAMTTLMAAMVIYTHRGNIARLRRGEEPRVAGSARRGDIFEE